MSKDAVKKHRDKAKAKGLKRVEALIHESREEQFRELARILRQPKEPNE